MLEKVKINSEARELLGRVGESLELKDEVRAYMKAFVLSVVYAECRCKLWTRQSFQMAQTEE